MSRMLTALACAVIAPVTMAGEITFTFDDPDGANEFQGNAGMPGSLTYDTGAVLDLVVDLSDCDDGGVNVFQAQLAMDLSVGTPSSSGGVVSAPVEGSFTFTDTMTNEIIFTATVDNAALVNFGNAGSVIASANGVDTGLAFEAGPALMGLNIANLIAIDSVFTLTDITVEQAATIFSDVGGNNPELNNFVANSAFTGTAIPELVPTPGAASLAGLGLLGFARRRRRA